jgi:hypothetical protein
VLVLQPAELIVGLVDTRVSISSAKPDRVRPRVQAYGRTEVDPPVSAA